MSLKTDFLILGLSHYYLASWDTIEGLTIINLYSPRLSFSFFGILRVQSNSAPKIDIPEKMMNIVDYLTSFLSIIPAIALPQTCELIYMLTKILLKSPLFELFAHSDMNFPWPTHRIPAPKPFIIAVIIKDHFIRVKLRIQGNIFPCISW